MKKITNIDQIELSENTLVVMFGVPASGKSYVAEKLAEQFDAYIASSDAIREELFGTAECQSDPNKVFGILQHRAGEELKSGGSVIIDATALIRKYRVSNLKTYEGKFSRAILIVCATEIEIILRQNQERDRHVPEDVITRMLKTMSFPRDTEGWDEIYILPHPENKKSLEDYLNDCKNIEHDNPHHKLGIYEHMLACEVELRAYSSKDNFLAAVGRYHDIGKPIVKSRLKRKGKEWVEDTHSHYMGHADVGAYMAACSPDPLATEDVISLINLHMDRLGNEDHIKYVSDNYSEEFFMRYMNFIQADELCDEVYCPIFEILKIVKTLDLDNLEESDNEDSEFLNHVVLDPETHSRLNELCCEAFISDRGLPRYDLMSVFYKWNNLNLEIIPGEVDNFGWLSACLVMNDGDTLVICFG